MNSIPQGEASILPSFTGIDGPIPAPEMHEGQSESMDITPSEPPNESEANHDAPSLEQQLPSNKRSKVASRDSSFRETWDGIMEGVGTIGVPHKQTAVLMISWAADLDDLDTREEVNALGDVFTNKFRYTVVKEQLVAGKRPSHQLKSHLAKFILDHDSGSTLLIIYYAGHGTGGDPGELHWSGKGIALNKRSAPNFIPWHSTEQMLQTAEADVLLIFDCCYAGNLGKRRSTFSTRSFEFLAACREDEVTHPPGPKSFTRALIWALNGLSDTREKFSTHELLTQLEKAPRFDKNQHVQVQDRMDPCDQRIVLAPTPLLSNNKSDDTDAEVRKPKEFFDVRFSYLDGVDEQEVEEVAKLLKRLILDKKIGANRIAWIRFNVADFFKNIVDKWRRLPSRKSMSSITSPDLRLEIPQLYNQGLLQSPLTPPASHSGDSIMLDYHIAKEDPFSVHGAVPLAKIPPSQGKSETDVCSHCSKVVGVDLATNPLPIELTITRGWLQPSVIAFGIVSYFYLRKYYN